MTDAEIEEIVAANPGAKVYIKKDGWYYRPGSAGYVEQRINAGIYSILDAANKARSCRDLEIIVIDPKEHNALILSKIEDLNSRIIIV